MAAPIGPNSISGGRVVFSFGESQTGIFLASPAACAQDVTGELSVTQTPPRFDPHYRGLLLEGIDYKQRRRDSRSAGVGSIRRFGERYATYGTQPPEVLNQGVGATSCLSPLGEAYLVVNGGKALAPGAG